MNNQPSQPHRRLPVKGWRAILPTLIILALVLLLTETTNAAPSPAHPRASRSDRLTFQEQQPLCQTCHPDEYSVWKNSTHASATLDPVFQAELAKSHNQDDCLKCHTTGFDTGSGKFMSEGVTCEACHGAYKEGHPAGETMTLPIDAGTCRMCHEAAFSEWEKSKHAAAKDRMLRLSPGAHARGAHRQHRDTLRRLPHRRADEAGALGPRHQRGRLRQLPHGQGDEGHFKRKRRGDLSQQPQPSLYRRTCATAATAMPPIRQVMPRSKPRAQVTSVSASATSRTVGGPR